MNRVKLRAVLKIIFILYVAILCYFLFFADYYGRSFHLFGSGYLSELETFVCNHTNFCPFATVILYVKGFMAGNVSLYALSVNLMGNFAAFMPFGFFLPYFFGCFKKTYWFLLTTISTVIVVEILQLVFMTGVCDIDDLILNVAGAYIIFLFTKRILAK